jgi:hypothetical protein
MMKLDRNTLAIVAVGFAIGWWWASSPNTPKPFTPAHDRPVLRFIAKAAKTFLWVAMFAEKSPQPVEAERHHVVQARVGDDGYPLVDHGRGW